MLFLVACLILFINLQKRRFFNKKNHINFLDLYCNHKNDLDVLDTIYNDMQKIKLEIKNLSSKIIHLEENNSFLSESIKELEKACLAENEEAILIEKSN